jgi:hypothetical protein
MPCSIQLASVKFEKTRLFSPSGSGVDLKALIQKQWTDQQVSEIETIIVELTKEIQKNGLKEQVVMNAKHRRTLPGTRCLRKAYYSSFSNSNLLRALSK